MFNIDNNKNCFLEENQQIIYKGSQNQENSAFHLMNTFYNSVKQSL